MPYIEPDFDLLRFTDPSASSSTEAVGRIIKVSFVSHDEEGATARRNTIARVVSSTMSLNRLGSDYQVSAPTLSNGRWYLDVTVSPRHQLVVLQAIQEYRFQLSQFHRLILNSRPQSATAPLDPALTARIV